MIAGIGRGGLNGDPAKQRTQSVPKCIRGVGEIAGGAAAGPLTQQIAARPVGAGTQLHQTASVGASDQAGERVDQLAAGS